ncbi:pectate lyase [Micromonospora endolithica]|uniref:pectate lyase n=1 Tax=Micromonospora endolithica TaxID=230091 RepID=A0A3A9YUE0_9ACTN|nr:pectate lyase [Micromonospora endolithica]RKN39638.1 pectate lyase [Micromonospora endolithica]TWJ22222.1 pectate lyase-like protein [Micromonospora endolithica]
MHVRRTHRRALAAAFTAGATATVLAAGLGSSAFAATVFSDNFDDGNSSGWSKSGGTWSVVTDGSGVLQQTNRDSELARQFAGQTSWTDYQVQARVKPQSFTSSSSLVGLAARSSSSTRMYRLALLGSGRAELQAVNGSQITVIGSASTGAATGTWYTLRIETSGSTIRGFVNGTQVGSGSDSLVGAGRIGLVTAYASGSFDDVAVDSGGAGTPSTPPSTTAPPTNPPPTTAPPTNPPANWPTPTGSQKVDATVQVSGTFDGGLKRYYGIGDGGQSESQDPMFVLAAGATLRNVVIGAPAGDGVHCEGNCTLVNVWWEDVGEDAATFRGGSAYTVDGGGARSASDKVFQHNGSGTVTIRNFRVENAGKLYRACGNCSTSYQRHVVLDNITARDTDALAGINTNWGDTARFTRITILDDPGRDTRICVKYRGVAKGSEPTEIGEGADGVNCLYSSSDITYR